MLFPQKSMKLLFFLFLQHIKEPTYSLYFITTSNSYQGIANLLSHQNPLVTIDNFWPPIVFMHINILNIIVVQCLSHMRLFTTPWTAALQASVSLTISWTLPEFTSTALVMSSNYLTLCHHLLLLPSIFPSIRVFSSELTNLHQVAKVLELQHHWMFRVDFL